MVERVEFKPNKRTQNIVSLMLDFIDTAERAGRKVVVGSGLGLEIEAAFKRGDNVLTRNHGDLDIHPMEEDIPFWKEWFEKKGYSITGNEEIKDNTKAFVAFPPSYKEEEWEAGPGSFYVDVYGIMVDGKGYVHSRETGKDDNWEKKWEEAFIDCFWDGRKITVIRHEIVLHNKRCRAKEQGTALREKDLHDHKLFNVNPRLSPNVVKSGQRGEN